MAESEFQEETQEFSEFEDSQEEVLISWTASEFIAHHKTQSWYFTLGLVAIILAIALYLFTKDEITVGFVLFGAFLLGVYAAREPRQLPYTITNHGLTIDQKYYDFQSFRSFTIVSEGVFSSILFTPLKRFGTAVSIYYAPEEEDRIFEVLQKSLPYDGQHNDPIDNFMRHIRF